MLLHDARSGINRALQWGNIRENLGARVLENLTGGGFSAVLELSTGSYSYARHFLEATRPICMFEQTGIVGHFFGFSTNTVAQISRCRLMKLVFIVVVSA